MAGLEWTVISEKLLANKRIVVLLGIGMVLIGAVWFLPFDNAEVGALPAVSTTAGKTVENKNSNSQVKIKTEDLVVKGVAQERDPFSVPPELLQQGNSLKPGTALPGQDNSIHPSDSVVPHSGNLPSGTKVTVVDVKLTGVASSENGTSLAVLSDGKTTKAYRIGEYVQSFQLTEINRDSVILTGPTATKILPIEAQVGTVQEKNVHSEGAGVSNEKGEK